MPSTTLPVRPLPTHHQGDDNPICLHLSPLKALWTNSILWFLSHAPPLPALCLTFACQSLIPLIHHRSPSFPSSALTLFQLTLSRRARDDLHVLLNWKLNFLTPCINLHTLSLSRPQCLAPGQALREGPLDALPQESYLRRCGSQRRWDTLGPVFLALDFPNARRIRFWFLHHELKLKLSLPAAFHTFSACAQSLILNCSSTGALSLEQLFLYAKERIHVSWFDVASVRALYLNAPIKLLPSATPRVQRMGLQHGEVYNMRSPQFSWADWLRAVAPTVEALITRHDINVESCRLSWPRQRSLGVVVESDCDVGGMVCEEITVEDADEGEDDEMVLWKREKRRMERREECRDQQKHICRGRTRFHAGPFRKQVAAGADDGDCSESIYVTVAGSESEEEEEEEEEQQNEYADNETEGREEFPELPFLDAPNLQALFFPSRCLVPPELLVILKDRYPLLELYCVAWRTLYWERKGRTVEGGPMEHMRQHKGTKKSPSFRNGRKTVRDKMHSVNGGLVAGYTLGEEDAYMVNQKDWTVVFCAEDEPEIELSEPDAPYTEADDHWAGEEDDEDDEVEEWG
ncbi:unnamed protein product [Closterium sp. Naga37s-1]|nr:unnamed protein product [Closterium sp. Naga37s-1]